jgi:hypothetical protein
MATSYDVQASAPGLYGKTRVVSAPVAFGDSTVVLETLAVGDVVIKCWAEVVTAFNAGSTNVLTLGDGTTGNKYLAASDVTEATPAVYPTGGAGPFKAETAAGSLTATFVQTGTPATTGAAVVYAHIVSVGE